ncbi:MAG: hypothetical protein FWG87_00435 [Defluviitaleaceae bacterium]|nr:hypothetical protein [Defluviitaleaceae bacterium]
MTADILLTQMKQLENHERNLFLDKIYEEYFDKGVPVKTLAEHARILEMYYDGGLVRAEQYDYTGC